ncbi:MAG: hypothetical protein H0T47_16700 [Planctomycetaceae bacterium]|nr:hypothetical protein [Planctomycetaceae bacterium]
MAVHPINTLELRQETIPRGPIIEALEREVGRTIPHTYRHYLEDQAVHCGGILELYRDGRWLTGRFEWTGKPDELPTFDFEDGVVFLDAASLLRWPK